MDKITLSNFSGGILESNNTDDYSTGQWSRLRGFIPKNSYTLESQWPIQSIGGDASTWTDIYGTNTSELKSVYPLPSLFGTYLIAIKEDGTVWFVKAPDVNDNYTTVNALQWTRIEQCVNYGYTNSNSTNAELFGEAEELPKVIPLYSNPDLRFITTVPLEVHKYIKQPKVSNDTNTYDIPLEISISSYERSGTTVKLILDNTSNISKNSIDTIDDGDKIYVKIADAGAASIIGYWDVLTAYYDDTTTNYVIEYTCTTSGTIPNTAGGVNDKVGINRVRANNIHNDTLYYSDNLYPKGTVTGVLMSSRRIQPSSSSGFHFAGDINASTHQTLIAYVDTTGIGDKVKVISFPNIRRWPQYKIQDEVLVSYTVSGTTTKTIRFTTQDAHEFTKGKKVKIKGVDSKINGNYRVSAIDTALNLWFEVKVTGAKAKKLKTVSNVFISGIAEPLNSTYNPVVPVTPTHRKSAGEIQKFINIFPIQAAGSTYTITSVFNDYANTVMEFSVADVTGLEYRDTITVSGTGSKRYNGTYIVINVDVINNTVMVRNRLLHTELTGDLTQTISGTITKIATSGFPKPENFGHPYTWLDEFMTLHPGTGFIPRGNVGTMWGGHLIIGDIEYKSESAQTASNAKTIKIDTNQALLGAEKTASNYNDDLNKIVEEHNDLLRDSNTGPARNLFYYSDTELDNFNPISVLQAGASDTRIVGMHQLADRLVVVTTSGSDKDGIIVFSGLLSQLHPYNPGTIANPNAVRREVIKGGVGPADYADDNHYDVTPTCLWPDASAVVFIDKRGGIYATNSEVVYRLDHFGPRIPRGSAPSDWVAATGKNLLVWNQAHYATEIGANSARLLCLTMLGGEGSEAKGAWTELIGPAEKDINGDYYLYNLKSFYGSGTDFFGVVTYYENEDGEQGALVKSRVIRFAISGPENEKGCSDGEKLILSVATPPLGDVNNHNKLHWNQIGLTFYTETGGEVLGAISRGASVFEEQFNVINTAGSTVKNYPKYENIKTDGLGNLDPRVFDKGVHNVLLPAGIGTSPLLSIEWLLTGNIRLESVTAFYTGVLKVYGDDVANEQ